MNGSPALIWLPEREVGYYPPDPSVQVYDQKYFSHYEELAKTDLGKRLTAARKNLVDSYYEGFVVDVGIGCGQFIKSRCDTYGFDVCLPAKEWLRERNLWKNPYFEQVEAATFWDSLEHIPYPEDLLKNVREWVFASLPIFWNVDHVLRSKHFKPNEHVWYWTEKGFKDWMKGNGFDCLHHSEVETKLGREDIHTFVFKRA